MPKSTLHSVAKNLVILLVCLTTACTTLRPITVEASGEQIRAEIRVGDTVRVHAKGGTSQTLHVTTVGMSSLIGMETHYAAGGSGPVTSKIEVPYQDIERLEVQRVSGARTTWLVIGAVILGIGIFVGVITDFGKGGLGLR